MTVVAFNLEVPKESKEVVDLLCLVLDHIKAKKPAADYLQLLDEAMVAAEGLNLIGEELKTRKKALAAYLVHELGGRLGL